jgi:hypothetical protein
MGGTRENDNFGAEGRFRGNRAYPFVSAFAETSHSPTLGLRKFGDNGIMTATDAVSDKRDPNASPSRFHAD